MASRCLNCNGILAKTDSVCYSCGDRVPKWKSSIPRRKRSSKGFSVISNIVFLASLGLTAFCLLAENKPPLAVSLAASGFLFSVKLIVHWASRPKASHSKA